MTTLTMLCGLPGSGKSTWVNSNLTPGTVVLSTDNYIESVAKQKGGSYNDMFFDLYEDAEQHVKIELREALSLSKPIFWDQTNLDFKTRRYKLRQIPEYYTKVAVFFEISVEEALRRNTRPGKFIPESTIIHMNSKYKRPMLEEGFDLIFHGSNLI